MDIDQMFHIPLIDGIQYQEINLMSNRQGSGVGK